VATQDPQRDLRKVADFLEFCLHGRGTWPPVPCDAAKLYLFFFWLRRHRTLGKGWRSALTWKTPVVRFLQTWQRDPFDTISLALLDRFKAGFNNITADTVTPVKLSISNAMFKAIWAQLDPADVSERVDRNLLMTFDIGGFRVGTLVLGSGKRKHEQIMRLKHVHFLPSIAAPMHCFVICPCTKTTRSTQPVGHVLAANPDCDSEKCAVKCLKDQVLMRRSQGAGDDDVLFANPRTGRPYSRNVFTTRLKRLIDRVASRRVGGRRLPNPPSTYFSGVSFRKSVLTRLMEQGVSATRISAYAHHKSVHSQMNYVCENFETTERTAAVLYVGLD
jgi:hypothetical protein